MQSSTGKKQPRWFLLGIAAFFLLGGMVWNWGFREVPRQAQVLTTAQLLLAFFLVVFLWMLFFSGLSSTARWRILVYTVLAVALPSIARVPLTEHRHHRCLRGPGSNCHLALADKTAPNCSGP